MSEQRQNNQLLLAFMTDDQGEAPAIVTQGTESPVAERASQSPATNEMLM